MPVAGDKRLPKRADVVIAGGGIIGCAIALELAERGVSVVVCEKGVIGGEQSSRNWGWCRQMGRDPREMPLILESLRLWRGMNERLGAETGFRQTGIAYLARDEAALVRRAAWLGPAWQHGMGTQILSSYEVEQRYPGLAQPWHGALLTPGDGRAEPALAAPAMAEAARRHGATILTGCALRGVETQGGQVSGAATEKGWIDCSALVVAGGAWSRLLLGNCGIALPQLHMLASAQSTTQVYGVTEGAIGGPGFALRKRLDGGFTIAHGGTGLHDIVPDSLRLAAKFLPALRMERGRLKLRLGRAFMDAWRMPRRWELDQISPFERVRVLDPQPCLKILEQGLANLRAAFPAFAGARIVERWAGVIDVTPDAVPVISPVNKIPGLFVASGFSGHGFGLAPGAGALMADLVTGAIPLVNPAPFRLSRFFDGSQIRPIAGF